MKNDKKIDVDGLNQVITTSNKILRLVYVFIIVSLVIAAIYIGQQLNVFTFVATILNILFPLFAGFIVAWLFNPLVLKLYNHKVPKVAAALIVYAGIIAFMFLFISLFVPVIVDQVNTFVEMLPSLSNNLFTWLEGVFESLGASGVDIESTQESLTKNFQDFFLNFAESLPSNAVNFAGSVFSGILTSFLTFIIGLYMLMDFDKIKNSIINVMPKKHKNEIILLLSEIGVEVRKCVNGILLIASMVFICDTIGFAIVGLEAALLLGLFCGITDLIPYIGPYIGGSVAVLVGYSQGPVVGTGVLVIAIIVQLLENYVMQPVVMSKATSTHPIIVIVALSIFGYFFGIVGMIFATPSIAVIKVLFKFFNNKFEIFGDFRAASIE